MLMVMCVNKGYFRGTNVCGNEVFQRVGFRCESVETKVMDQGFRVIENTYRGLPG